VAEVAKWTGAFKDKGEKQQNGNQRARSQSSRSEQSAVRPSLCCCLVGSCESRSSPRGALRALLKISKDLCQKVRAKKRSVMTNPQLGTDVVVL